MSSYIDNDGTLKAFVCRVCHGEIEVTESGPDWKRWSCPCGKTTSLHIDGGKLDLGSIEPDAGFEYEIFPGGSPIRTYEKAEREFEAAKNFYETRLQSAPKIYHAFALPPWVMEGGWTLRRRLWWRVRHPRRWWRVVLENHRAKKSAPREGGRS